MKYRIPEVLRERGYLRYFYTRVRRMKRNGYDYDTSESIVSNLMIYASHLNGIGKTKLAEKEIKVVERLLNLEESYHNQKLVMKKRFRKVPVA